MMNFFHKTVELLTPSVITGGLEVSDSAIRFMRVSGDGKVAQQESLRLPAGIVEDGRVRDLARFEEAVSELKEMIEPKRKPVHIILTITSGNVYAQTVFLPEVAAENIDEAARLNIQMMSPLNIDSTYNDWQKIQLKEGEYTDDIEILAAVVNKEVVDEFAEPLKRSGFVVLAVEFTAMSLGRIVQQLHTSINPKAPEIGLFINSDGIELFVMRSGELYFNYYQSWAETRARQQDMTVDHFNTFIRNEITRLAGYYEARYRQRIERAVVIAPGLQDRVIEALADHNIEPVPLQIKEHAQMPAYWYVALGAALRARIPRYSDESLSLTGLNTRQEYDLLRSIAIVKVWRNSVLAVMGFAVIMLAAVLIFLVRYELTVRTTIDQSNVQNTIDREKYETLQNNARQFNALVAFAQQISSAVTDWRPLLRWVSAQNKEGVSVISLNITKQNKVSLSGQATSRGAALAFRSDLMRQPWISDVDFPVVSIIGSDPVRFTTTFLITDFRAIE